MGSRMPIRIPGRVIVSLRLAVACGLLHGWMPQVSEAADLAVGPASVRVADSAASGRDASGSSGRADPATGVNAGAAQFGDAAEGGGRRLEQSEAVVLQLVRLHLPELRGMLERLRAEDPLQYRHAIDDLEKSARRLDTVRRRDEQLYEIEVRLLQAKTSVNLAIARLKIRDASADRQRLRDAITRLKHAEQQRAEYEVQILEQRLARIEQQLTEARLRSESKQADSVENIDTTYRNLLRRAGRKPDS